MTTCHAMTASQPTVDGTSKKERLIAFFPRLSGLCFRVQGLQRFRISCSGLRVQDVGFNRCVSFWGYLCGSMARGKSLQVIIRRGPMTTP